MLKFFKNKAVPDTVILIDGENCYIKSEAALRIAGRLNSLWPLFYILKIIPVSFRDWIYTYIANNRYRWFGKRDACMVPEAGWKERFL